MDGPDAMDVLQQRMKKYSVKGRGGACSDGEPGQHAYTGGFEASGCYVNEDSRANLRYVVPPWDNCRNLKAGGTRIRDSTLYVAVLGPDDDLATLTKWAEPASDPRPHALYKRFRKRVDACGFTPPM